MNPKNFDNETMEKDLEEIADEVGTEVVHIEVAQIHADNERSTSLTQHHVDKERLISYSASRA